MLSSTSHILETLHSIRLSGGDGLCPPAGIRAGAAGPGAGVGPQAAELKYKTVHDYPPHCQL
jgi:hypothetical protein